MNTPTTNMEERPTPGAEPSDTWQSLRALVQQPPDDMTFNEREALLAEQCLAGII